MRDSRSGPITFVSQIKKSTDFEITMFECTTCTMLLRLSTLAFRLANVNIVDGKAYIALKEERKWSAANDYCEWAYQTNLAVIEDSTDETFVRDAATAADISTNESLWIGLYDTNNNTFEWIDNTTLNLLNYTNWNTSEPNNNGDCVHKAANDYWINAPCSNTYYPVCDCDLYIGVANSSTWSNGESYCLSTYGTHLATFRNKQEFECLYQTAYSSLTIDSSTSLNVWVGLHENSSNNNWIFSEDSTRLAYEIWNDNEPKINNSNFTCAEIGQDGLNDINCDNSQYFVCNNRRYIGVNELKTWDEAESYCQLMYGTSLATIMTDEQGTNARTAATIAGIDTGDSFWFGFNDISSEGTWEWIDGTTSNGYTNWDDGEPNNSGGDQDCGEISWAGMWFVFFALFCCFCGFVVFLCLFSSLSSHWNFS